MQSFKESVKFPAGLVLGGFLTAFIRKLYGRETLMIEVGFG